MKRALVAMITVVVLAFTSSQAHAAPFIVTCEEACEKAYDDGEISKAGYHLCLAACDARNKGPLIIDAAAVIKAIIDAIKNGAQTIEGIVASINWTAVFILVGGIAIAVACSSGACVPALAAAAIGGLLFMPTGSAQACEGTDTNTAEATPVDGGGTSGGGSGSGSTCGTGCQICAAGECCDGQSTYVMSGECLCANGYRFFCD